MNRSVGALQFLLTRSLANRVRVEVRRARSPRYAIAIVLGALWLWTFLGNGVRDTGAVPVGFGDVVENVYELLLALTTAWLWIFGASEPGAYLQPLGSPNALSGADKPAARSSTTNSRKHRSRSCSAF